MIGSLIRDDLLPGGGAVDPRRLEDVAVDALQRRQHHDEDERRPLPDVGHDHGAEREPRLGEPGARRRSPAARASG